MKNFNQFKSDIESAYVKKYSDKLEVIEIEENVIDTKINGEPFVAFNLEHNIKLWSKINSVYDELTFAQYVAERINNKKISIK